MQRISLLVVAISLLVATGGLAQDVTKYVRYQHGGSVSYGVLEGNTIHELRSAPFDSTQRTGDTVSLSQVGLLTPTAPRTVIAVGLSLIHI